MNISWKRKFEHNHIFIENKKLKKNTIKFALFSVFLFETKSRCAMKTPTKNLKNSIHVMETGQKSKLIK